MSAKSSVQDNSEQQDFYSDFEILCLLYGRKCAHCGATSPLEIDHIMPRSAGGSEDIENKQLLCKTCNRRKGTRPDPVKDGFAHEVMAEWVTENWRKYCKQYRDAIAKHEQSRFDLWQVNKDRVIGYASNITIGTRLEHLKYGCGTVTEVKTEAGDIKVTIKFASGKWYILSLLDAVSLNLLK